MFGYSTAKFVLFLVFLLPAGVLLWGLVIALLYSIYKDFIKLLPNK